jgi:hypothetical protein
MSGSGKARRVAATVAAGVAACAFGTAGQHPYLGAGSFLA